MDRVETKVDGVESKVGGVKSDQDKMGAHNSKLFGLLQTKIDNLVRQMHAVEEGQKKTNKLLQVSNLILPLNPLIRSLFHNLRS